MIRLVFFLFGFICLVAGFTDVVLYLNLLTMGYTLIDFIHFIVLGYPMILLIVGFILITTTIFKGKRKKDEYGI